MYVLSHEKTTNVIFKRLNFDNLYRYNVLVVIKLMLMLFIL